MCSVTLVGELRNLMVHEYKFCISELGLSFTLSKIGVKFRWMLVSHVMSFFMFLLKNDLQPINRREVTSVRVSSRVTLVPQTVPPH